MAEEKSEDVPAKKLPVTGNYLHPEGNLKEIIRPDSEVAKLTAAAIKEEAAIKKAKKERSSGKTPLQEIVAEKRQGSNADVITLGASFQANPEQKSAIDELINRTLARQKTLEEERKATENRKEVLKKILEGGRSKPQADVKNLGVAPDQTMHVYSSPDKPASVSEVKKEAA